MGEYIEREAKCHSCFHKEACLAWMRHGKTLYDDFSYSVEGCPYYIPAADVALVEHGVWKPYQTPIETRQSGWICTNCSGVQMDVSNGNTNYCPNCGARMDGS